MRIIERWLGDTTILDVVRIWFPIAVCLVVTCSACGAGPPLAPDPVRSSSITPGSQQNGAVTISGVIYETTDAGDPPIADAVIEVTETTQPRSTRSRADGSYALVVEEGQATITASKEGFESKTWRFTASNDIVLNFSLARM
jgi:hypothetical protein